MATNIISNGSKWARSRPDSIDALLVVLANHSLDPKFERYGNFIEHIPSSSMTRFLGNFHDLSHVFCIETDEPEIIARLTRAIRANQLTEAYAAAKRLMIERETVSDEVRRKAERRRLRGGVGR